jgi:nucleotide-binding universal stress UspA family protein
VSTRSVMLVPADRTTNVELVTQVARVLAAPGEADIRVLNVTSRAGSGNKRGDWRGVPAGRLVRLRGNAERIVPAYAHLVDARGIVLDRHFGTNAVWRNTDMVARMSRSSPAPVLALPSRGHALTRLAGGHIQRIVAAVDSTFASAVALRTAVTLARRFEARVTMLHALEHFPAHSVFSGGEAWRLVQQLSAKQRQVAERFLARARRFGEADVVASVVTGDAVLSIAAAAAQTEAEIVVMGVAPRTWLDQSLFGSTLRRVLRRAEVPVLVVPVAGGDEEWSDTTVVEDVQRPDEHAAGGIAA